MTDTPTPRPRVLVAEDESLVAMLIETYLEDAGCELVGPAASVADGLALLERERVDAALFDINLAGEPVFPLAEAAAARGLPFAFSSGYGAGSLPEAWRGRPVIGKPFDGEALLAVLTGLLERRPPASAA